MLTVQQGIPNTLIVGDAASFTVTDKDHPQPTWTSQILFKHGNDAIVSFTGAASGSDHLFALANTDTAKLSAGDNLVCLVFSDGTNRQSNDWQGIEVLADPTKAEQPSFAQQQVTLLQGAIARLNATTRSSVSFNGQSFQRSNLAEYQKQLVYYEARVIREDRSADVARGIKHPRGITPEFIPDGFDPPLPHFHREP